MSKSRTVRSIIKMNSAKVARLAREAALAEMEHLVEVVRYAAPFSAEWCSAHEAAIDVQSKLDGLASADSTVNSAS